MMRVDIVSIFPGYLAPLDLSLIGRARRNGLLDLHVHDLRDFTHDRHRTVDDTPYGGGPGMVMKPEPWGEALDHVLAARQVGPVIVIPGPGGAPFTQGMARDLAAEQWLVFGCGRYEGIDERVYADAARRAPVRVVSLGDYVLNGGEAAVLAMVEAIARLLPGVIGNAQSLVEESHEDGLLEYPVYTKPPSWRGFDVPEVLLSGDHGRIAAWRHRQRLARTSSRRPDLLHESATVTPSGLAVRIATRADVGELLTLTRACWVSESFANPALRIPALHETFETIAASLHEWQTYAVRSGGRLIASVRGQLVGTEWHIGRLMVAPDLQGRGIGRMLLEHIQRIAPAEATAYTLVTGAGSVHNHRLYRKAGFRRMPSSPYPGTTCFGKRRVPAAE